MKKSNLHWFLFSIIGCVLLINGAIALWIFRAMPNPDELPERFYTPSIQIVDRYNRLLYEVIDHAGGRHTVVPLEKIPFACQQATIATEDRSYYTNPGFDLRGVLRAAWINLRGGEALAGGSTITQQVARNLLMSTGERSERSLRRKLREVYLAWVLSRRLSKENILTIYLNQTYYGGMAYGIDSASYTYFGKSVERLDLAECSLLAGIPQAPALYNPFTDLEAAKKRQAVVLNLMHEAGFVSGDQAQQAVKEPLQLAEQPYPIEAPHFIMMVRQQIDALFSPEQIYNLGGLVVRTTLDANWQKLAEKAVDRQLSSLSNSNFSLGHNVNNAALVAIDPGNGDVLTLVGSPDYFDADHAGAVNMAVAPRQPGSALKPIVYTAALDPKSERGGWTAATMILDVRTSFLTHDGKAYIPVNYDLREHGPVLVREALASSLNIPAVLTLQHIGLETLFDLSRKMGVATLGNPNDYDLSLALGGGAVRLIDLTSAYGVFANGGYRVNPRLILDARDFQDRLVYQASDPSLTQVLDPRVAWLISDILNDNDARKVGFGANSLLRLDRPAAVKTGTTTNFHDNWTIGYTPELVVGVWSGNTDYQPMREVNGLSGAAPIWHEFMRAALADRPKIGFNRPPGFVQAQVCALSGMLPTSDCSYRRLEWFIDGTQPYEQDRFYRSVIVDSATGHLADESTPVEMRQEKVVLDLPLEAQPWAHEQGLTLYTDLLKPSTVSLPAESLGTSNSMPISSSLLLVSPASGSTFHKTSVFSDQAQRIRIEAVGPGDIVQLKFWVDGVKMGTSSSEPFQLWWTLEPGDHLVWVEGLTGEGQTIVSPSISFTVLN